MPEEGQPTPVSLPELIWPIPLADWMLLGKLITVAFVLGCLVAFIYALTMRTGKRSTRPFLATLVLLSVLIALVTLLIGGSIARAFGLVGALSIVRFRTVVQDTRDTAFVIFAVVVGMAAGSGYPAAPLVGMPFVLLATWLFRQRRTGREPREMSVAVKTSATHPPGEAVQKILDAHSTGHRVTAAGTARGGAALEVTYLVHLRSAEGPLALVAELCRVEGVQSVELKER